MIIFEKLLILMTLALIHETAKRFINLPVQHIQLIINKKIQPPSIFAINTKGPWVNRPMIRISNVKYVSPSVQKMLTYQFNIQPHMKREEKILLHHLKVTSYHFIIDVCYLHFLLNMVIFYLVYLVRSRIHLSIHVSVSQILWKSNISTKWVP